MIPKDLTLEVVPRKLGSFRVGESLHLRVHPKTIRVGCDLLAGSGCRGLAIFHRGWLGSVLPKIQASLEDDVQGRLFSEPRQNGPWKLNKKTPKILKTLVSKDKVGSTRPGPKQQETSLPASQGASHLHL